MLSLCAFSLHDSSSQSLATLCDNKGHQRRPPPLSRLEAGTVRIQKVAPQNGSMSSSGYLEAVYDPGYGHEIVPTKLGYGIRQAIA